MNWTRLGPPVWFAALAAAITVLAWWADEPVILGLWEALDVTGSVWSHWWTADALGRFANPFVGTHSYLPVGLSPVLQYNLLDAAIHAPLIGLFGPHTGYNAAVAVALFATGWSAFGLARATGQSVGASMLAGTLVQGSSIVLLEAHEGRISQVTLVFFLLALREAAVLLDRGPTPARGARLGLWSAAAALVYWYHGFALLLAFGALAWAHRRAIDATWLRPIGAAALVGAVFTVPFAIELMAEWPSLPGVTRLTDIDAPMLDMDSRKSGTTVAIENSRWPLWPFVRNKTAQYGHELSVVAIALCAVAVRARTRAATGWLGVAVIGWVLAMGPVLQGWGTVTAIPLPFGLLQDFVPTFSRMWWPQRFEVLTVVGVAMAAGMGLDAWLKNRSRRRLWVAAAVALCVVDAPLRSGLGPIAITPTPPANPPLYEGIEGPILTVPVMPGVAEAMRLQWNQTVHGLPTQNGDGEHIPSHRPPGFTAFMESNGLITALDALHTTGSVDATVTPSAVEALIAGGFRYAVADPAVFGSRGRERAAAHGELFTAVWGDPIRRHRGGGVWAIAPIEEPAIVRTRLRSGRERMRR